VRGGQLHPPAGPGSVALVDFIEPGHSRTVLPGVGPLIEHDLHGDGAFAELWLLNEGVQTACASRIGLRALRGPDPGGCARERPDDALDVGRGDPLAGILQCRGVVPGTRGLRRLTGFGGSAGSGAVCLLGAASAGAGECTSEGEDRRSRGE